MHKVQVGFLLFPGVLQLDLTGAYGILAAGPEVQIHLVWKNTDTVTSSDNLVLKPSITMESCPQLDVLCVPGGAGILPLLEDAEVLSFLRQQAGKARFVTSVCTGALVLGAAGLLQGYQATTHWSSTDLLDPLGAVYVPRRVVQDRNRLTAAGVTSGIDMALLLAKELWGEEVAKTIALNMEYAPEPPFTSGSPDLAPAKIVEDLRQKNATRQAERGLAVQKAARRLH